jgi:hypothetical protein
VIKLRFGLYGDCGQYQKWSGHIDSISGARKKKAPRTRVANEAFREEKYLSYGKRLLSFKLRFVILDIPH